MQVGGRVVAAPGFVGSIEWLTVQVAVTRGQTGRVPPLAVATTDALGRFRMVLDDATPWQAVSFSVQRGAVAVPVRNMTSGRGTAGVDVTLVLLSPGDGRLAIATLADLRKAEAEAVARLGRLPQGGIAFFTDPIRALGAAGVDLAPQAVAEFKSAFPHAPTSTTAAFDMLMAAPVPASVRIRVRGLFQQEGGKP